jgi:hypothetical protein
VANLGLDTSVLEETYLAPPQVLRAAPIHDGGILVTGRAAPAAKVVLTTPEGQNSTVTANARGLWTLQLPPTPAPRLFALSSTRGRRMIHAQGALVTVPRAAYAAVMVRAGYAALPLGGGPALSLVSMDYDPSGFVGVSGTAPARSTVRLTIDDAAAGVVQADDQGRFASLAANRRLGLGSHQVTAEVGRSSVTSQFSLTPAEPLSAPYLARSAPAGWRIEWALNGGGLQTTVLKASG